MMQRPVLSLVFPAWNEAVNLPHLFESALATGTQLGFAFEIVVVDDGSADASDLAVDPAVQGVDKPALLDEILTGFDERGLEAVTLSKALRGAKPVNRLSFSA